MIHEFVEYIPDNLEENVIYISLKYGTVLHKCCCGCGNEVITPLTTTDWKLIFDGETISLYPSIGNWNFTCQSHYWIKNNQVLWAQKWTEDEINSGRFIDYLNKNKYYRNVKSKRNDIFSKVSESPIEQLKPKTTFWAKLKDWWFK